MRTKGTRLTFIVLLLTVLFGCSESSDKPTRLPKSNSAPWEMLLVANKEWLKTADGEVFMQAMQKEIPGLNQVEPSFKVMAINPAAFSKSFQGYASIVIADFGSKYTKADMKMTRNVYAQPQIVLTITAPTGRELAQYAADNASRIMQVFVEAELLAQQKELLNHYSTQVLQQAKKQFGIEIYVPKDVNVIKKVGDDFFWATSEEQENRMNICIYSLPLATSLSMSPVDLRDSVMQKNVRGYADNQYMATVDKVTMLTELELGGQHITEMRGLWEMKNDMMGGSFISHTRIDSAANRLLVAEGFVYAPNKTKRKYIRSLEAALRTLRTAK